MKENKKVKNVLQKYMQWPVVLSALVLCANGAVGLVSGKARYAHGRVYGPVCILRGGPLLVWKKADPDRACGLCRGF